MDWRLAQTLLTELLFLEYCTRQAVNIASHWACLNPKISRVLVPSSDFFRIFVI